MIHLRCSDLPLLSACPASSLPVTGPKIGGSEEAADLGSGTHEGLSLHVLGEDVDLGEIAAKWAVDYHELGQLFGRGVTLWAKMEPYFRPVQTEVEHSAAQYDVEETAATGKYVPKIKLTGHIDVLSVIPEFREVRIADWKTGRLEQDHVDQMRGYSLLALDRYPECDTAFAVVLRVRDGTKEEYRFTRPELWAWWKKTVRHLQEQTYNVGAQCKYCPRALECPALERQFQRTAAALLTGELPGAFEGQPNGRSLANLLYQVKLIEKHCQITAYAIEAKVAAAGGELPIDEGTELHIRNEERKPIIAPLAWEILRQEIGEENLIGYCVKLGKENVLRAVKAQCGRGQKGKAAAALMGKLERAEALGSEWIQKLEIRRRNTDKILPRRGA